MEELMLVNSENTVSGNKEGPESDVLSQFNVKGSTGEEFGDTSTMDKECCQEEECISAEGFA